jgi:RimJ/RimL family protein N-acetyltransferase
MPSVLLEPLEMQHFDEVARLVADPEIVRFTRIPEPPPDDFAVEWIARYRTGRADGTRDGFAAIDAEGRFVGLGLAPQIDRAGRELELGYMVASSARGRGFATEILRQMTDWAFDELGALRIYLIIGVDNHASHRVAERCGYVREGVMRSIHLKQHQRIDSALWSRLPTDPQTG